ncbi:craniofacial development protein 2-like [Sitophilus oryzae]|uniref:Craniofacial development protein 2-like n=1 Tax=Sitophilus oryzae TaxID=7048 RepID=A0A6J2YKX3_SITOR|nr:craniofacial development protein 2-like [Sitophilus oryzae]
MELGIKRTLKGNLNGKGLTFGTWNIRSINDKEGELIKEFENIDLDILAITETKKKGKQTVELQNGHIMILSGVQNEKRAQAGVGCIIKSTLAKFVTKWDTISGIFIMVQLRLEDKNTIHILILYGPNEDEKAELKYKFWDEVTEVVDSLNGDIIVLGDLNGRVGIQDYESGDDIGKNGEAIRNNNGTRIIEFCIQNYLLIMNTFFRHKEIHQYTREVKSRNEKSIIDYVLVCKRLRRYIKDVRVKRGPEINSDHYLVLAKTG